MISTSGIFSTGEKKWMPMKLFGRCDALARPVIGSVDVLLANTDVFGNDRLGFRGDVRLDAAVLEHRLDHEIGAFEQRVIDGRLDTAEDRIGLLLLAPALFDFLGQRLRGIGLAFLRGLERGIDQHDVHAGHGRHVGNARTHHAGAEHAELLDL